MNKDVVEAIKHGVMTGHRSMFIVVGERSRDKIVQFHSAFKKFFKRRPSVLWCSQEKLEPSRCKTGTLKMDDITYCTYQEYGRILGNTYGICILQDPEAFTISILTNTTGCVESGGIIIVLDVKEIFLKHSYSHVLCERLLLSARSGNCVFMDDELQLIPNMRVYQNLTELEQSEDQSDDLEQYVGNNITAGDLLKETCTIDQAKAFVACSEALKDKRHLQTVALIGGRGRGKSATLGLVIATAVHLSYTKIIVTAQSAENVKTLFEYICKGLKKEKVDFTVVKSLNLILKIKVWKEVNNPRTIKYIQPHQREKLKQANLLVVDEFELITFPDVKSMLGFYPLLLSSTLNRSDTLNQLEQLGKHNQNHNMSGKTLKKIEMKECSRFASNDPVESFIGGLSYIPRIRTLAFPGDCQLYFVKREILFSHHESIWQRRVALYILSLMANTPWDGVFVFSTSVDEESKIIPDIFCVIQISFEESKSLSAEIPWNYFEECRSSSFARIVHMAANPVRWGYGSAAVKKLIRYFKGEEDNSQADGFDKDSMFVPLCKRKPEIIDYLGVSSGLKDMNLFRFWNKNDFSPFFLSPNQSGAGDYTCTLLKRLSPVDEFDYNQVFRRSFIKKLGAGLKNMKVNEAMRVLKPKYVFQAAAPSRSDLHTLEAPLLTPEAMGRLEAFIKGMANRDMIVDFEDDLARAYFDEKIPVTLSYRQTSVLLGLALQGKDVTSVKDELNLEERVTMFVYEGVMRRFYKYLSA